MKPLVARFRRLNGLALGGGIGGLVAVQLASALLVQILVLRIVGAGEMTDAFIAAQTIPLIAMSIVGTALQNIWQPRLAVAGADWRTETGLALTMTLAITVPVSACLLAVAPVMMRWLFLGFSADQAALTATLTRINLIAMVFNITALILAASGRARARFLLVELAPASMAVLALLGIAIAVPQTGVKGATWVLAMRAMTSFTLLWIVLGAPMPRDPRGARLGETARAAFALMGGSSLYKLGPVVDRFWSSQAAAGQMTLYNLAQSGMGAVATLLERAIALPAVPDMARALEAGGVAEVRRIYRRSLVLVWAVTLAGLATGAVIASAGLPIIADLLKITEDQSRLLIHLSLALGGFLGVAAGGTVVNSIFYAAGDARTPVLVGMASFAAGVLLKSFAFIASGLVAMALATSVYYVMAMAISICLIERKLHAIRR